MKYALVFTLLAALMLPGLAGCTPPNMTPEQIALASYGTSYTATYVGSRLFLDNEKVTSEELLKIDKVISETVLPYLTQLEDSNDLYVVFYPLIEAKILEEVEEGRIRTIALALISQGLRIGENYLDSHPEINDQKDQWLPVVTSVFRGIAEGCRDAANPTSEVAQLRWRLYTEEGRT